MIEREPLNYDMQRITNISSEHTMDTIEWQDINWDQSSLR